MSLKQYLFLRLSLGFVSEFLSFVGKHSSFFAKDVCSFSVFFIFNKEELIQQVRLNKYIKNEILNSTTYKIKKQKKSSKNIIQLHNYYFLAFMKALNALQINIENQTFTIILPFYKSRNAMWHRLLLDEKSIF